jgi:hypothetical protein
MKIIWLAIGLLILLPAAISTVNAQHKEVGIKGGLSPYTLNFSNNTEKSGRARTHIGMFAQFELEPTGTWSLQPEVIYSLQGAKIAEDNQLITLDYLNIPVLLQYMPYHDLRFEAGPQFGILINAVSYYDGAAVDLKRKMNSVDFGISTGVNYLHRPSRFGVDFRYNIGLRNISENGSLRSRNRGFQIGIYYLFDFSDQL